MPTYAQLQSEPWWGRESVSDELDWLGDELCRYYNRPRSAAGTKGDNLHLSGAHRSQEWILKSAFCGNRFYTVQSGLTALQLLLIAGFDFTPGDLELMILQSRRLLRAMKAGELEEVRELYCNVDGDQVVDGWDNVRNRAATSDKSHLWHWHLTIDRRFANVRAVMEKIFRIVTEGEVDDDMDASEVWKVPINAVSELYNAPASEYLKWIITITRQAARIETLLLKVVETSGVDAAELEQLKEAARLGAEAGLLSGADELAAALATHLNLSVEDVKVALAQVLGEVRLSVPASHPGA